MPLSLQRRRRALKAHQLREDGHSLRQIADHLNVSHTAVHNDLQALETHRPQIIQAIADDKLLDHIQRLEARLERLLNEDAFSILNNFGALDERGQPTDLMHQVPELQIIRYFELHERTVRNALTEYRLALRDLRASTRHRIADPEDFEADYPIEELADPEQPTEKPVDTVHQTLPGPVAPNPNLNGKPAPANQTPPELNGLNSVWPELAALDNARPDLAEKNLTADDYLLAFQSLPDLAAELCEALPEMTNPDPDKPTPNPELVKALQQLTEQAPTSSTTKLTRQQRRAVERANRKSHKRAKNTPTPA